MLCAESAVFPLKEPKTLFYNAITHFLREGTGYGQKMAAFVAGADRGLFDRL